MNKMLGKVNTLCKRFEKGLGVKGQLFILKAEPNLLIEKEHHWKENEKLLKKLEEVFRENEELKGTLDKGKKRVTEEWRKEMKCWKLENGKANVNFKEIVEANKK